MMARSARLIVDQAATGSWNMAVDQALLAQADEIGQLTLRFYCWDQPTLSLGYFQSLEERVRHPASLNCPLVRRTTGGGAILHDQEITYSLSIPSQNRWSRDHERLYETVHRCVIAALGQYGVTAQLFSDRAEGFSSCQPLSAFSAESMPRENVKPFLCFQRRTSGDIVCGANKICGSAQRRKRNAVLQHGSVLWKRSRCAPELAGIEDISPGFSLPTEGFIQRSCALLEDALEVEWLESRLEDAEWKRAQEFEQTFLSSAWLQRKRQANF
jgi:lipoate-protein ligase A